jgi:hypothetical protein
MTRTYQKSGVPQPYRPRMERKDSEARQSTAVRVDRDPCFYCGARGDVGCVHRVAR